MVKNNMENYEELIRENNRLKKSEEKYKELIENTHEGILIAKNGIILFANNRLCEMISYTKEEMCGELITKYIHEEDRDLVLNRHKSILKGIEEPLFYYFRLITKYNNIVWVQVNSVISNIDNETQALIYLTDITSKKQAEEKSNLLERRYKNLVEYAPDTVILVGLDGKIKYASYSVINFGYTEDEILNIHSNDITHPEDLNFVHKTIENIIQKPSKVLTIQYRFKHKTEGWIWIESTFSNRINEPSIEAIVINSRNINDKKIYQDKLVQSENKFSNVFKLIPDSILITSIRDGVIIEANNQFFELSGYSYEELIGKTTLELNFWGGEKNRNKIISNLLNKEKVSNMEIDFYSKNGDLYKCSMSCEFIELNDEKYVLSVIRDETKKAQIQNKLNDERIKLKTLLETIPDMIWLKDINGVYLSCNSEFESFFGAKEEDIIGKTDFDFVDKELAEFFRENDKKAIYANKPIPNNEWVTFASDGHKELLQTIKTPMYDCLGNLIGVLGIARDITELYKSQEEIKGSESRLKEAQSLAKLGSWELDLKTNKLSWSDEIFCIFEIDKNNFDTSYESFLDAIHPDDREIVNQAYTYSVQNKTNYSIVHRLLMKDLSIKYVQEIGHTEYDDNGLPNISIGTVQDITDRVKIEEEIRLLNQNLEEKVKERTDQLEKANKDLESFAYSISHDLRAPLRHIDGFTKLLKNSIKNPTEDSVRYFDKIIQSANKMSGMIDDLLKFSRLGRKVLEKTDVDLNLIIKDVIEQYKSDIEDRKIEFIIGELPIVKGDQGLLQIVFDNLISNAIKFTSKKDLAIIKIGLFKSDKDNKCNIYIKDNGAGFDMIYSEKLFGVFQRLHPESEFSGTGIGLANVKQIIQKHGGSIHVESEVNKGTTFYLSL